MQRQRWISHTNDGNRWLQCRFRIGDIFSWNNKTKWCKKKKSRKNWRKGTFKSVATTKLRWAIVLIIRWGWGVWPLTRRILSAASSCLWYFDEQSMDMTWKEKNWIEPKQPKYWGQVSQGTKWSNSCDQRQTYVLFKRCFAGVPKDVPKMSRWNLGIPEWLFQRICSTEWCERL